jgi:4-amino-4-deoxy-L-arabinose transferase-like glycosyltransferase
VLGAFAAALYGLPLLIGLPLLDPDEGLHAAIAQEMVERGDFIVPRFLGAPFLDKPILFFLAQAMAIRMFGATEFAVRLPGQIFGLLGAVTAGAVGWSVAGRRAGIAAACIHATMVFPLAVSQAAVHDVALVPWTNLAIFCFVQALRRNGRSWPVLAWCGLAGVWLGLAMLTKGLAGVALVGLPIVLLVLLERRLTFTIAAGGVMSVVLGVLIALPWYLAVERVEPGYLRYFFVERHYLGFATTTQMHGARAWWYYFPIIAGGSLPWIVTTAAAWQAPGQRAPSLVKLRRLGWIWLGVDLVFLSAAGSKLATYVLPLFPAVALVTAVTWLRAAGRDDQSPDRLPESPPAGPHARRLDEDVPRGGLVPWIRTQAIAGALILPGAVGACYWLTDIRVGAAAWLAAAGVASVWLAMCLNASRWGVRRHFVTTLAGVVLILVVAYMTLFPAIARAGTARDLAEYFNMHQYLPPRLLIVDERVGSFLFYLSPQLRQRITSDIVDGMPLGNALVQGSGVPGTIIAVPESTVERLKARLELDEVPFEQAGRYRVYEATTLRAARPRAPGA